MAWCPCSMSCHNCSTMAQGIGKTQEWEVWSGALWGTQPWALYWNFLQCPILRFSSAARLECPPSWAALEALKAASFFNLTFCDWSICFTLHLLTPELLMFKDSVLAGRIRICPGTHDLPFCFVVHLSLHWRTFYFLDPFFKSQLRAHFCAVFLFDCLSSLTVTLSGSLGHLLKACSYIKRSCSAAGAPGTRRPRFALYLQSGAHQTGLRIYWVLNRTNSPEAVRSWRWELLLYSEGLELCQVHTAQRKSGGHVGRGTTQASDNLGSGQPSQWGHTQLHLMTLGVYTSFSPNPRQICAFFEAFLSTVSLPISQSRGSQIFIGRRTNFLWKRDAFGKMKMLWLYSKKIWLRNAGETPEKSLIKIRKQNKKKNLSRLGV